MTVAINGTLGVNTPQVTLEGAGVNNILQPSTVAGTYTATFPPTNGQLLVSSVTMNFPTTLGTNGQVLTTNGAGVLTWTTVSSGGSGTVTSIALDPSTTGLTVNGGTAPVAFTTSGTFSLGGTLNIANGGTGAATAVAALNNLLPAQATNAGKFLTTDGLGGVSWAVAGGGGGGGTVTSITFNPSTTGMTINGVTTPTTITTSGTFSLGGILNVANGGTGLNTVGPAGEVLVSNGTSAAWASVPPATDLANGAVGEIPYQLAANSTAFVPAGTAGQVLRSNGAGAPSWVNVPNAPAIAGGAGSQVLYQSAPGVTAFVPNGTIGQSLTSNGAGAPAWSAVNLGLAAAVTGTLPITNGGTGATTATGALNNIIPVSVSQIKLQLITDGTMQTVSDAVPADVTDVVNVRWFIGMTFEVGDPLYNFIQTTLSYSAAQMTALMTNASARQK